MLDKVALIGNVSAGFGDEMPMAPTAKTPNIEEATQDFVSLLYSYVFQEMRNSGTDEENSLFGGENAGMFMSFLDQAMGQELARTDGASLAKDMLKQLQGNKEAANDPVAQAKEREAQLRSMGLGTNAKPISADVSAEETAPADSTTDQILQQFAKMNGG